MPGMKDACGKGRSSLASGRKSCTHFWLNNPSFVLFNMKNFRLGVGRPNGRCAVGSTASTPTLASERRRGLFSPLGGHLTRPAFGGSRAPAQRFAPQGATHRRPKIKLQGNDQQQRVLRDPRPQAARSPPASRSAAPARAHRLPRYAPRAQPGPQAPSSLARLYSLAPPETLSSPFKREPLEPASV